MAPGNNTTSEWVGPDTGDGSSLTGGVYSLVYRTTVDLTGFNPATAVLQGRWSTDNSGTNISVNGTPTGNTAGTFNSWFTFTLNSGFVAGVNNIDFAWSNAGGPGGVRVEFTSATADLATSGVPEPASVLLTLTGAAALAFFKRRTAK
jgi:PEP-CTERM putative exosortase interaction domain